MVRRFREHVLPMMGKQLLPVVGALHAFGCLGGPSSNGTRGRFRQNRARRLSSVTAGRGSPLLKGLEPPTPRLADGTAENIREKAATYSRKRLIWRRYLPDRYRRGIRESWHPTSDRNAVHAAFAQVQSNTGRRQISESPLLCALFSGLARFEGRCIPWRTFVITAALIRFPCGFRYRLWSWFKCHECSPF